MPMDSFYQHEEARQWLDQHHTTSVQTPSTFHYLSTLRVGTKNVTRHQDPRSLRLTEELAEGTREVEVRIPGIICSKTLPPQVRELSVSGEDQIRLLRQFVKLSGLGSAMFEGMGEKVQEVWHAFVQAAAPATIAPLVFNAYDGDYAIDAHTRYFTDRRHAPSLKHEDIPLSIDPRRHLDSVRGANFIYSEDNCVEYCQRSMTDGRVSYVAVTPATFQIGDVVEVGAAFVAYPAGKDNYVLKVTMRSLCLLNSGFREDAARRRDEFHASVPRSPHKNDRKRERSHTDVPTRSLLKRRLLTSQGDEREGSAEGLDSDMRA